MLPSNDVTKKIKIHITTYSNKKKLQQKEIQTSEIIQMCDQACIPDLQKRNFVCSLCLREHASEDIDRDASNNSKTKYKSCPFCQKGKTAIKDACTYTDLEFMRFDNDITSADDFVQTRTRHKEEIRTRNNIKTENENAEEKNTDINKMISTKSDELRANSKMKHSGHSNVDLVNHYETKTLNRSRAFDNIKTEIPVDIDLRADNNIKFKRQSNESTNTITKITTTSHRNKEELKNSNNMKIEEEAEEKFSNNPKIKTERQTDNNFGANSQIKNRRQSNEDFNTTITQMRPKKQVEEEFPMDKKIKKEIEEEFDTGNKNGSTKRNKEDLIPMNEIKIENNFDEENFKIKKPEIFDEVDSVSSFVIDNVPDKTYGCCRYVHNKRSEEKKCCRFVHSKVKQKCCRYDHASKVVVETQTSKPSIDVNTVLLNEVLTVFQSKKAPEPLRCECKTNLECKDESIQVADIKKKKMKSLSVSKLAKYSINDNGMREQSGFVILESRQPDKNRYSSVPLINKQKSSSIPQMKLEELKYSIKEKNNSKDTVQEVNRMFAVVGKYEKESKDDLNRPMVRSGPRILPVVKTEVHRPKTREVKDNFSVISHKTLPQDVKYNLKETKDNFSEISDSHAYKKSGKMCQTNEYYMSSGDSKESISKGVVEKSCEKCVYMLSCRHNRNQAGMLICECCRKNNSGCKCCKEDFYKRGEFQSSTNF